MGSLSSHRACNRCATLTLQIWKARVLLPLVDTSFSTVPVAWRGLATVLTTTLPFALQAPQGFQQPAPNFAPPAPGFQQPPQGLQQPMPPGYGVQAQMGMMSGPPSTGGMMGGMHGPGMMGGAQGPGMAGGMSGPPSSTGGGGAAPMGMGGMGGGGDMFTGYLASGAMQSAMGAPRATTK